jgi:hypothetical protein
MFQPRPRGWNNPCLQKHRSVRGKSTAETRVFDAIDDAVYDNKLVGAHRKAIVRLLDSIIELRDLESHLLFMRPAYQESTLDAVFQEFSQAMAYYLKRADTKDAEALALHAARILAESPTSLDGLWETIDFIIGGIGQLCHVNVGVLEDAMRRFRD